VESTNVGGSGRHSNEPLVLRSSGSSCGLGDPWECSCHESSRLVQSKLVRPEEKSCKLASASFPNPS
jgi:hypothetical protein